MALSSNLHNSLENRLIKYKFYSTLTHTSTTIRRIAQTPWNRRFFEEGVDLCSRGSNYFIWDLVNICNFYIHWNLGMEETLPESDNNDTTKHDAGNEPVPAAQSPEVKETMENMEIHHYPDLKHKKKHLKEYLIEFLMLFFAVTLGFLAENLREHLSEKDRAGIYAKSLYEDFTTDTSVLHKLMIFTNEKITGIDSMEANLNHLGDRIRDSILYRSVLSLLSTFQFDNINGAYDQIKNTGSLRFFNQSIVNDLTSYDATSEKLKLMEDWENKLLFETVSAQTIPMFNFKVFEDI
jgi:hypothetical protein